MKDVTQRTRCAMSIHRCLVAMAEGKHAYPSRTRPLRPPAPMILGAGAPGKVGRRQAREQKSSVLHALGSFVLGETV
jgi:hypothetical protein